MFKKQFTIRWSDIDANKHLANSAYINFMSHTRMSFLTHYGLDLKALAEYNLGPIVFYEHIYYFREVLLGEPINVSLEVTGYSADGRFIKFEHNFYDLSGKNLATSDMLFSWIDLNSRKLGKVPESLLEIIDTFPKSECFKILTKEDTRVYGKAPKDLT